MPTRRTSTPSDDAWRNEGEQHMAKAMSSAEQGAERQPYATCQALMAIYCELRHQGDTGEMGTLAEALRRHAAAMEDFGPRGYRG
jgi:hypothetical protein